LDSVRGAVRARARRRAGAADRRRGSLHQRALRKRKPLARRLGKSHQVGDPSVRRSRADPERTLMKRLLLCLTLACLPACQKGGGGGGGSSVSLKTDDQKTLYALGLMLGRNLTQFNLKPEELDIVKAGITDQAMGAKPQVELQTWGPKVNDMARGRQTAAAQGNKDKGKAYADKAA